MLTDAGADDEDERRNRSNRGDGRVSRQLNDGNTEKVEIGDSTELHEMELGFIGYISLNDLDL